MRSRSLIVPLLGLLAAALFVLGVIELFQLREAGGDIYPPYSSLRADPLGTKALYEALSRIPGLQVQRNYTPIERLHVANSTTLYLGTAASSFLAQNEKQIVQFSHVADEGGRLVISFQPTLHDPNARRLPIPLPNDKSDKKESAKVPVPTLLWGVTFAYRQTRAGEDDLSGDQPATTLLYFDRLSPAWQVRAEDEGRPVLIERPLGRGSIVLSAGSYYLSNEALAKQRDTATLVWLIGPNHTILFDENHLGVSEGGSVTGLVRRYRLEGFVAGLLLLFALFIWQRAIPFVPPVPESPASAAIAGQGAQVGLVRLLRRSIPHTELTATCLAEWSRALPLLPRYHAEKIQRAKAAASAAPDSVSAYSAVRRILTENETVERESA